MFQAGFILKYGKTNEIYGQSACLGICDWIDGIVRFFFDRIKDKRKVYKMKEKTIENENICKKRLNARSVTQIRQGVSRSFRIHAMN
jgi:hypothetical protein